MGLKVHKMGESTASRVLHLLKAVPKHVASTRYRRRVSIPSLLGYLCETSFSHELVDNSLATPGPFHLRAMITDYHGNSIIPPFEPPRPGEDNTRRTSHRETGHLGRWWVRAREFSDSPHVSDERLSAIRWRTYPPSTLHVPTICRKAGATYRRIAIVTSSEWVVKHCSNTRASLSLEY